MTSFLVENVSDLLFYLDTKIGILVFAFIYIFSVILIFPASWLSLVAGYLYGPYYGSLIVFVSAFLGASITFFISRKYFSSTTEKIIRRFSKLHLLELILQKGGLKLIILTRLSPLFPFSLLNYFYGFNKINYQSFAISLLFIIPGTYLYCSLGSLANSLSEIQSLKNNSNITMTLISIISTSLVVYLTAKYANQVINES